MSYINFIESKAHYGAESGIPLSDVPDCLFDFQGHIASTACRFGRYAGFIDTGLGKTLIELCIAQHYAQATNKPTLILTPLAVAYQFQKESIKFDVGDVSQTKDGTHNTDIVTCNYERIDKLNPDDFGCVILDESGILKSYQGSTSAKIIEFLKRVKYRFLFTATPAPNDYIELGTSSEALGYMGNMDMLNTFFTNKEKTSDPSRIGSPWFLKPHAEDDFFSWVNSWSLSVKNPSCIGFSDEKYLLPDLIEKDVAIDYKAKNLNSQKLTFRDIRQIQKDTVSMRCEKAAELAESHDTSVFWCHRNDESEMLSSIVDDCIEVKGSMKLERKEEVLIAFAEGQIKKIVTKPKITGFGLNWQHCNHTVYFPTYSYEQYYQSIRRFWRFGQAMPVHVDRVHSTAEDRIIQSLTAKGVKANQLYKKLNERMNSGYTPKSVQFDQSILSPKFK